MKTEFIPVWKRVTPELAQELVVFWQANKAIAQADDAAKRAMQAVCIVRDEAGTLCGVVTAVIKVLPRLRQPMYYYRMFFARALRGQQQFLPAFVEAKRILQDYNAGLAVAESLGLLLELENDKLGKAYPHAFEPEFGAVFIGYSPRGLQLRVSYFDGATLLPPVPVRAPALAARGARPNAPRTQPASRRGNARP